MDDFENTDQSTAESFPVGEESNEPEISINPAWQEALDRIPEEFHQVLTPTLSEWDKNFQKVQQEYAPYKDFAENGIPADRIQQSIQIADLLESNPRGVYDYLNQQYQFNTAENLTGPKEEDTEESFDYDVPDIEKHPKFQEMSQQVARFQQLFEQQEQAQIEQRVEQQIHSEFESIAAKHGELDEQSKMDIARLAMGAGDNDLSKAAEEYFTRFRQPVVRANDSAPPVIRGNGRLPQGITPEDIAKMDSEDRIKNVALMMQGLLEGN